MNRDEYELFQAIDFRDDDWTPEASAVLDRIKAEAKAEALWEARAELRHMMDGFAAQGRHTRAAWALLMLDDFAARYEGACGCPWSDMPAGCPTWRMCPSRFRPGGPQ